MNKVVRYYMIPNARTIRGHWEVWEVVRDENGRETKGKRVDDCRTKREAGETVNRLNDVTRPVA
jgi:hypothetical protein